MIPYRQAIDTILSAMSPLTAEYVPLTSALHRIVVADLIAPYDMPPFGQSLMDGYAVRSAETRQATPERPVRLALGRTLTAGEVLTQPMPPQQVMRIMTGASMPPGSDAIVKVEGQFNNGCGLTTVILQRCDDLSLRAMFLE